MRVRQGIKALVATVLHGWAGGERAGRRTRGSGRGEHQQRAGGDVELHHGRDDLDPDRARSPSNFSSLIYGEKAYYQYINAQGGVNGRKIDYKYALDDGGNPTTFNQLANTLINQDHVFAVTGVATAFFSPNLFVESGIPTYGYNVTGNWAGPPEPLRRRRLGAVLPGRGADRGLRVEADQVAQDRLRGLRRRGLGGRLPGRRRRAVSQRVPGRLHRLQGQLPRAPRWPPTCSA